MTTAELRDLIAAWRWDYERDETRAADEKYSEQDRRSFRMRASKTHEHIRALTRLIDVEGADAPAEPQPSDEERLAAAAAAGGWDASELLRVAPDRWQRVYTKGTQEIVAEFGADSMLTRARWASATISTAVPSVVADLDQLLRSI